MDSYLVELVMRTNVIAVGVRGDRCDGFVDKVGQLVGQASNAHPGVDHEVMVTPGNVPDVALHERDHVRLPQLGDRIVDDSTVEPAVGDRQRHTSSLARRNSTGILNSMTTWFTADLHFGHRNIITYCDRPFTDVDQMNELLVRNWNETVDPEDTVWVLGDVAMGRIDESLALVTRLAGHKILVAGNHDRCWFGHGERAEEWQQRYLDAGFERIIQGSTHVSIGDTSVLACHFPYTGDSQAIERYVEHRPVDEGEWLIHGHVHEQWANNARMINVGVDVREYRPMSEAAILAILAILTA